jgi:hypothetical protein
MEQKHPELIGGCGIRRGVYADIKVTREWGGPEIKELAERMTPPELRDWSELPDEELAFAGL